jgi:DNA-binding transcriptional regulator YdaS (Cro superfamily)
MKCPPTLQALNKAVALAGSETRLSRATGYSQPAINKARRRGRVSAELAIAIERALGGAVTRAELRPDLFGGERT